MLFSFILNKIFALMAQWLVPCISPAGGMGSIPGQGTKVLHGVWHAIIIIIIIIIIGFKDEINACPKKKFKNH